MKRRRLSKAERREVYSKMNGHCAYCGCELQYKDMQIDHILSLMRNGKDELFNMLPACGSCNHRKDTLTVEDFRKELELAPSRLMRDSATYRNAVRFRLVIPNPEPIVFYFEREVRRENSDT